MFGSIQTLMKEIYSRHKDVAAYLVFGIGLGASVMSLVFVTEPYRLLFSNTNDVRGEQQISALHLTSSTPKTLHIEKIGVNAPVEILGLHTDGSVEVPKDYDAVGWYKYGPTPGELGPSVILGHVDTLEGTAVFGKLYALEVGDRISVDREEGTAEFEVEAVKMYAQDEFPTDEVYGDVEYAGLRLITCAGFYDRGTLRYSHNLVVYARLVEST